MKKTITTAILTATAAFAFANEPSVKTLPDLSLDRRAPSKLEITIPKSGFSYFRLNATDSHPTTSVQIVPGLGIGYRIMAGNGAIDLSANYSSSKGWKDESNSGGRDRKDESNSHFWTLPKASYIHYMNASGDQSAYGGIGLAWGGMKTKNDREFEGVIGNATVGMEFFRKSTFRTFAELNVSQPAVARTVSTTFPGPIAEFSIGAGF